MTEHDNHEEFKLALLQLCEEFNIEKRLPLGCIVSCGIDTMAMLARAAYNYGGKQIDLERYATGLGGVFSQMIKEEISDKGTGLN